MSLAQEHGPAQHHAGHPAAGQDHAHLPGGEGRKFHLVSKVLKSDLATQVLDANGNLVINATDKDTWNFKREWSQ